MATVDPSMTAEQLADTVFHRHAEWPVTRALVSQGELRTLARDAGKIATEAAEAENRVLRDALKAAPHGQECLGAYRADLHGYEMSDNECTCWKANVPTATGLTT